MNSDKTKFMCFNQDEFMSEIILCTESDVNIHIGKAWTTIDRFLYLGSSISSTESDINIHIGKEGTTIDMLIYLGSSISSTESDVDMRIGITWFLLIG